MSAMHSVKELHGIISRIKQSNTQLSGENKLLSEQINALQRSDREDPVSSDDQRLLSETVRDVGVFRRYDRAVETADPVMLSEVLQSILAERDTLISDCEEFRAMFLALSRQCEEMRSACATMQGSGGRDSPSPDLNVTVEMI